MEDITGAVVHVGYGKETTRGTAVAPSKWIGKYELNFIPKADKVSNESGYGHLAKTSGQRTLRRYGEGDLTAKIFDKAIGDFMQMVTGQAPTSTAVAGQTGVYKHVFSLLNTNTHPSYTIATKEGGLAGWRFPAAMLDSLKIEIAGDDYAKMTASFLSEEPVSASDVPAYTQENEFVPENAVVKIVAKGGDLNAATAVADVTSATIEIKKNVLKKETLGNTRINPRNGRMEVTADIELLYNTQTFRQYWHDDTKLALRLEVTGSDTIGTSTHPSFTVDIPFVTIDAWEPDYGGDDLVPQSLKLVGQYDATNGKFIDLTVVNTQATYA